MSSGETFLTSLGLVLGVFSLKPFVYCNDLVHYPEALSMGCFLLLWLDSLKSRVLPRLMLSKNVRRSYPQAKVLPVQIFGMEMRGKESFSSRSRAGMKAGTSDYQSYVLSACTASF